MSKKYHTKHPQRGKSHYPERLVKRGLTSAGVRMPDLRTLRRWQEVEED